jgi:AcrR family transcriptional regulator
MSAGESLVKRLEESPVEAVAGLLDLYVDLFADFDRELVAAAMTDPSGLGQAFFAQDLRLIGQLDALLQELRSRGDLDRKVEPGRGAVTLYGVYLSWFMAYLANDSIKVASLREQVRAGIAVVMHGLIHPERLEEDSP